MDVANWMDQAPVVTSADESLRTALLKMQLEDLESLPVLMSGFLIGLVTKEAVLDAVAASSGCSGTAVLEDPALHARVVSCMLPAPVVCRPTDSLSAVGLMLSVMDIDALPVVNTDHSLAGVVHRETVFAELVRLARQVEIEDRLAA